MAENCCVKPAAMLAAVGVTARLTKLAGLPVPLKEAVCGELAALSVKVNVPVRLPVALGENTMDAVQLAPAASVLGLSGQVVVSVKSLGLRLMLVILSVVVWLLVSVTICAGLAVPSACPANVSAEAFNEAANRPVPVKLTVGLALALVLTVNVPLRVPAAEGVK